MEYLIINLQTLKADGSKTQTIFRYSTKEEALSTYHNNLAYNYASDALSAFTVLMINEYGGQEMCENWKEAVEEEVEA